MTLNVNPTFFAQEFRAVLQPALQQKGSRLRAAIMDGGSVSGAKQAVAVDRLEQIQTNLVTGQAQPKTFVNAQTSRRWVQPISRDASQLLDHFDKLKTLQDPTSATVQNAINAHGRDLDDEILDAAFRAAATGETGTGSTAFDTTGAAGPTGNQIALNFDAAANTRVTVAKLREAKRILMYWENDFDNDPAFVALTDKEHDSLLKEAQAISLDYNDRPVLVDGKISRFMGFNFIFTQRLQLDATATWRRVPVWMKSGLIYRMWEDTVTTVNKRDELKGEPFEVYSMATFGAVRSDEKRIVEIKSAP